MIPQAGQNTLGGIRPGGWLFKALVIGSLLTFGGCGGSGSDETRAKQDAEDIAAGGDDNDTDGEIHVRGTLRSVDFEVEDISVCALGDCDTTDGDGTYELTVPEGLFFGGDVLFTFESDEINAEAVAQDLPGNGQDAVVDFNVLRRDRVVPILVAVDRDIDDDDDGVIDGEDQDFGDGSVTVSGLIVGLDESVVVCALGQCDVSDGGDDRYVLNVDAEAFNGGDVLFTFRGEDFETDAVAQDLPGRGRDARVDFAITNSGAVSVLRVGVGPEDPEDVADDIDDIDDDVDDDVDDIEDDLDDIDDDIDDEVDDIEDDFDEAVDEAEDEIDEINDDDDDEGPGRLTVG